MDTFCMLLNNLISLVSGVHFWMDGPPAAEATACWLMMRQHTTTTDSAASSTAWLLVVARYFYLATTETKLTHVMCFLLFTSYIYVGSICFYYQYQYQCISWFIKLVVIQSMPNTVFRNRISIQTYRRNTEPSYLCCISVCVSVCVYIYIYTLLTTGLQKCLLHTLHACFLRFFHQIISVPVRMHAFLLMASLWWLARCKIYADMVWQRVSSW